MKVYSHLQRGDFHSNFCEDYIFLGSVGEDRLLAAVMDGCSSARESYFASALVGKILKKILVEYRGNTDLPKFSMNELLKDVTRRLFSHSQEMVRFFHMDYLENLTTVLIMLLDIKRDEGLVFTIGDGVVCINGEITAYDQDNRPDFLGYHLEEDFEQWFIKQQQLISFHGIKDVTISTDGIEKFRHPQNKAVDIDPLSFLLIDKDLQEDAAMLSRKVAHLEELGLRPPDDLGMIRLIRS